MHTKNDKYNIEPYHIICAASGCYMEFIRLSSKKIVIMILSGKRTVEFEFTVDDKGDLQNEPIEALSKLRDEKWSEVLKQLDKKYK